METRNIHGTMVLSITLAIGCSVGDDDDRDAQRQADALADQYDVVEGELEDCLEALDACLAGAQDPADFEACGAEVEACLGDVEPPPPPEPPEIPDDVGLECADGLTDCLTDDPFDPTCYDAFDTCLAGVLDGVCEDAHQQCLDAGAPQEICDTIAC